MNTPNRREFLRITVSGIGSIAFGGLVRARPNAKRPNILWLSCEDISPHLGCYGEPYAITPNIDQFAREGVRYTKAFTVHGVCAPSRSGIITGMYPSSLGTSHMRCRAKLPEYVRCFPEYLRRAGYYCTNNSKEDYNFDTPKTAWDESSRTTHWRNRPKGKPFFAVFNFTKTHESKLWNSADFDNTHPEKLSRDQWQSPDKMKVPPLYPDTPAVRRDLARYLERITEFDYFVKEKLSELKQAGLFEDTIVFIWSDHGIGLPRAKRWLYDTGTRVPLIVRIPEKFRVADQAKLNTVDEQLISFIDLGPTVLNLAEVPIPKHMDGRAFLGRNLGPPRKYIFGASDRIDERHDIIRSVRDKRFRYIRNYEPYKPYFQHVSYAERCNTMKEMRRLYAEGKLHKASAQFMADSKPVEELYDLEKDPYEIHNLAADLSYRRVMERMREALTKWMIEIRDTGLLPESELVERSTIHGSRYAILHEPGGERLLSKLHRIATIAGKPSLSDQDALCEALSDNDSAVRYWGAMGLGNLGCRAKGCSERLLEAAQDESPSVRIAVARALYLTGMDQKALDILLREIRDDRPWHVKHFAMEILDLMGERARPAITAIKETISSESNKYVKRVAEHTLKLLEDKS